MIKTWTEIRANRRIYSGDLLQNSGILGVPVMTARRTRIVCGLGVLALGSVVLSTLLACAVDRVREAGERAH
jgi:hypothetical protein